MLKEGEEMKKGYAVLVVKYAVDQDKKEYFDVLEEIHMKDEGDAIETLDFMRKKYRGMVRAGTSAFCDLYEVYYEGIKFTISYEDPHIKNKPSMWVAGVVIDELGSEDSKFIKNPTLLITEDTLRMRKAASFAKYKGVFLTKKGGC